MDTGQFYLHRNGEQYGPYSKQDLGNMAQKSELLPDDLIWCEGMPDWQSAQALFPATRPKPATTIAAPKAKKVPMPLLVAMVIIGVAMLLLVLQAASKRQNESVAAAEVAASPTPPPQPLGGPLGMTRNEIAARFGPHKVFEYMEQDPNETNHEKNGVSITVTYYNGKADQIQYWVDSYSDAVDILGTFGNYADHWKQEDASALEQTMRETKLRDSNFSVDYDTTSYMWESKTRHPAYGTASASYVVGSGYLRVTTEEHGNRWSENFDKEQSERSQRLKGL